VKIEHITLKETKLTNNCPECYSNDGMTLSFKQERQKSKFLVRTKKNISESIVCDKCETIIYPGQWTMDIERVYHYHKKTITPASGSLKFTTASYILLILMIALIGLGYIYIKHPNLLGL